MLFPKSRGLRVTLHSAENRDNLTMGDRRATKMLRPPLVESTVGSDKESLLWWWCLTKIITDVCSDNNVIFDSSDSIKESRASMIDTVGIRVVENSYLARSGGTVAGATCLLPTIVCFDIVGPHQIEDSRLGFDMFWVAKHVLLHVLVEL